MAKSVIANGTTANDGTGDTLRSAATKINNNFSEIYTKLGGDSTALTTRISFGDGNVTFEGATADSHETTLIFTDPTADRQIVFPNASGNVLLDSSTNTLTNKTLTSPVLTTPQINDTSADHQYVVAVSELAADRTITLPLLTGDDEVTFNAHTQTLTNKSLTTPTINAPKISGLSGGGVLQDSSGNEVLELTKTASAVNHINITNNATNNNPKVSAKGTDTNIDIEKIVVMISADHSTPCINKGHSDHPVPLLISGNKIKNDDSQRFTESDGAKGEIGLLEGAQVVNTALEIIKSQK